MTAQGWKMKEQIHNYLDWLEDRGVYYPTPSKSAAEKVASSAKTLEPETHRVPRESDLSKKSELIGRKILWLDTQWPSGPELHIFTRLCLALNIKDHEFQFEKQKANQDMGAFLEKAESLNVNWLICFSSDLAEQICDDDMRHIAGQWQDSAYGFKILPGPSLTEMKRDPKQKIHFWRALQEIASP